MSSRAGQRAVWLATASPTTSENAAASYRTGDLWVRTDTSRVWALTDASAGTWTELGGGGGGGGGGAPTGSSYVTISADGTLTAERTLTGTTSQITITDGGANSPVTLAIASNPVLPGTGGFVPPSGTTAQRPGSPTDGTIRWNTSSSELEFRTGSGWVVIGDLAAHVAASDPHTGYQKESEKASANGYASLDGSTLVPTAQLGSGTADSTTFLRGDGSWQVPGGGSGLAFQPIHAAAFWRG